MGKPRMIILIRHAQSEGNKNRDIHQYIPDHRVKLTSEGWAQAEDAGRRLREMLNPDDSLQFFTSPYRRTRETTEGILRTLTSDDPDLGPSPFARNTIKVYEEPRLREQDFGNFQPCSAEMERMWQERADYGHFFYRIPNGESAADAYDRVSGFNESLWRSFSEPDFPSVCVLVTHGLMTRVFLMKWYHWSVEYFEDLRNINHCEFIVMTQTAESGKFVLQNQLRTWSDLKRRAALANGTKPTASTTNHNNYKVPSRRWGGCARGCDHGKFDLPPKPRRQNTADYFQPPASTKASPPASEQGEKRSDNQIQASKSFTNKDGSGNSSSIPPDSVVNEHYDNVAAEGGESDIDELESSSETEASGDQAVVPAKSPRLELTSQGSPPPLYLRRGRDAGGSLSGIGSPNDVSDDSDYFDTNIHQLATRLSRSAGPSVLRPDCVSSKTAPPEDVATKRPAENRSSFKALAHAFSSGRRSGRRERSASRKTEQEWMEESGMTGGKMADALGDVREESGELAATKQEQIEEMKMRDRSGLDEVY